MPPIPRNLTMQAISASTDLQAELAKVACQRFQASRGYYQPKLDAFLRFFKIYRSIVDVVDDPDEPNTGASYAFGIIEDAVAALSEAMLNARVPTPARGKRPEHNKGAEKFNAMAATYFTTGQYQEDYPNSVRERMITGNSWEMDSWAWKFAKGRRWEKQKKTDIMGGLKSLFGRPMADAQFSYEAPVQVEYQVPVKVGYHTRFPSVFHVLPQPRIKGMDDASWVLEVEERVALSDLESHQYVDPESGQLRPFFDLSALYELKRGGSQLMPEQVNQEGRDFMEEVRNAIDGMSADKHGHADDEDQGSLLWTWERDRLWCLANARYPIAYIEDLHQRPIMPYRLKRATPQSHSFYGIGMIEPVESLFYEQDDIHKLSMRNWVRIINKMIAYDPEAVPHAATDFLPRAGGKVRVRPGLGQSISSVIMPIEQGDVTQSMLGQESNNKGLIERALGMPDFSKGVEGTKQDHDTLGGMQIIANKSAKRVASMRRQELAGFQRQMHNMEVMHAHFLVEKMPFTVYGPDGQTSVCEYDLWDIDTGGIGFDYVYEYDPTFGDDALARQQFMLALDEAIKYNQAELALKGPKAVLIELPEVGKRLFKSFGWSDTSKLFVRLDGVLDPEEELKRMMSGEMPMPNPGEDLVAHYSAHARQYNDPRLHEAVSAGKLPPQVILALKSHLDATAQLIMRAMQDPAGYEMARQIPMGGPQMPGGPEATGGPKKPSLRNGVADMQPRMPSA